VLGQNVTFLVGYNKWPTQQIDSTVIANGVSAPLLWKIIEQASALVPQCLALIFCSFLL
jgi:hypothetical protein